MFNNDIEFILDFKSGITWIISGIMLVINGWVTFEEISHRIIDILTIVSLMIAIGYTINRWYKYIKK